MRRFALASLLAAVCAVAPTASESTASGDPAVNLPKLDILFVVDNSGSMSQEQASLTVNLPLLLDQVAARVGALPDLHIGVVSSSVGIGGYSAQGCTGNGDNGKLQNTPRTAGCGFEQHMEGVKRALDGVTNPTTNANFLRDDAYLAVIFLADEDDCSAADPSVFDTTQTHSSDPLGAFQSYRCTEFGVTCDGAPLPRSPGEYTDCAPRLDSYIADPADYVAFLTALKGGDPNQVFAAAIVGASSPFAVALDGDGNPKLEPSCTSEMGTADPGVRLAAFVSAFPYHRLASICADDLSMALVDVGTEMGDAVMHSPRAVVPAAPLPLIPAGAADCQVATTPTSGGLACAALAALSLAFLCRRRSR